MLAVFVFLVSAGAWGAQFHCPAPQSAATVACTFSSIGGTTTFVATVSASANGSASQGSAIALFVTLDGAACNNNYGVSVPVVAPRTSVTLTEDCTFDVPSNRVVNLVAYAQSQNATPAAISLSAVSVAFVPDPILTVDKVGEGSIVSADGRIDCGVDCWESYSLNATTTLFADPAHGWVFSGWSGKCSGAARACTLTLGESGKATANFTFVGIPLVVEFYNATLDHYFITAEPLEASAIDNGSAGPGWVRTGLSFRQGGDHEVCRFYGSLFPGPNSHFYTAFEEECYNLKQLAIVTPGFVPRWYFESIAFMTTRPFNNGACPAGTIPVYRAYNDGLARGRDANHRITTSLAAIGEVVARGWKSEGVGMCAP
jgi:hypothetical protein